MSLYVAASDASAGASPPVCQKSWGSGSIGFGCRDCEADSQCIICPECFFAGEQQHEQHRVRLIHTSGGCCDCGDAASWKPSGFCSRHRGVTKLQEAEILSRGIRPEILQSCLALRPLLVQLAAGGHSADADAQAALLAGAELEELGRRCAESREFLAGLRQTVLTEAFLQDLLVKQLLQHTNGSSAQRGRSSAVTEKFTDFFLTVMQLSPSFKEAFGRVFARNYSECMRSLALSSLTVQLFTIPAVAEVLVFEEGLLDTVVTNLLQSLSPGAAAAAAAGGGGAGVLSLGAVFWRVVHDLKYLLQHPEVFTRGLLERPVLLRVVECVRRLQHENFQVRVASDQPHVEFENQHWRAAFKHEELLLDVFVLPLRRTRLLQQLQQEQLVQLVRALVQRLPLAPAGAAEGRGFSFHVPLLRLLVLATPSAEALEAALDGEEREREGLGERLVEECGRVLRVSAEIGTGVWVRNGQCMEMQNQLYSGGVFVGTDVANFATCRELDMQGVRLGLALLHTRPDCMRTGCMRGLKKLCTEIFPAQPALVYEALFLGDGAGAGNAAGELERRVVQTVGAGVASGSFGELASDRKFLETDERELEDAVRRVCGASAAGGGGRGAALTLTKEAWRKFDVFAAAAAAGAAGSGGLGEATRQVLEIRFPIRTLGGGEEEQEWLGAWLEETAFKTESTWLFGLGLLGNFRASNLFGEEEWRRLVRTVRTRWSENAALAQNALLQKLADSVLFGQGETEKADERRSGNDRKWLLKERQRKLQEAMQKRQAAFVQGESEIENAPDTETETEMAQCMVCREGGETLGFASFILGTSEGEGGSISACGHEFHAECWKRLIGNSRERHLNFQHNEVRCPVCRSLCNALVPGNFRSPENTWVGWPADATDRVEFLARAAVKDLEISIKHEPAKCLNWGSYPPVFARLVKLLQQFHSSGNFPGNFTDPKMNLVLGADVPVGGNLEMAVFKAWVRIAMDGNRWADGARNSLAFIADLPREQQISVLQEFIGPEAASLAAGEASAMEIEEDLKFPITILEAIKEAVGKKCSRCDSLPQEPALCLGCRELLCVGCVKCRSPGGGECTTHAKSCTFNGHGIFLLPFSASVALVTPRRSGLWEAPYVDSRGETDQGLRRTVRLQLDPGRAENLKLMLRRGTLDAEIVRHIDKSGSYVPTLL